MTTDEERDARKALYLRVRDDDFAYHPPLDARTREQHEEVNRRTSALAEWMAIELPLGRDLSLALTELENVRMRANKAVALGGAERRFAESQA